MALFESYERREKQILEVLKGYGINSIEECADICKEKGFNPYEIVEKIQPICFENAKWAVPSSSRRAAPRLPKLPPLSARDFRLSVSPAPLPITERLVSATAILAKCCLKRTQSASAS